MADSFSFVQAQPFTLAGSGAASTATSITLTSFKQIDGTTNLTMADFGGTIGYATLEPNSGTQEEQISFSGVTQNASGTATLTGVKTVLFVTPYTETSGLAKSHAGGTQLVISNTAGFYNKLTAKDDDETITGVWTFSNTNVPRISASTAYAAGTELRLATKEYVDSVALAGAPNASVTQKGIVQLPTQSGVDNKSTTGGTGALFAVTPDKLRATKYNDHVTDTGTATAYAIAPSPAVTAYATGLEFRFLATHTNTGTATLAVNGLAAKNIRRAKNVAVQAGDIVTNLIVGVIYDGTAFQMISNTNYPKVSSDNRELYATSTTGSTAYTAAISAVSAYTVGLKVYIKPDTSSHGGATLNINSLGAKSIARATGQTKLVGNDIRTNTIAALVYNGTNFELDNPGSYAGRLYTNTTTSNTIASTISETNIFSVILPAKILGINGIVKIRVMYGATAGFGLSNTKTATFRLKYGGSTLATMIPTNNNGSGSTGYGVLEGYIIGAGATNAQQGSLTMNWTGVTTGPFGNAVGTGAVDSTVNQPLVLSVQFNNSSANDCFTADNYFIEQII